MHTYIPTYLHLYTYKYTSALDMVEQMKVSSDAEYMEGVAATKAEAAELKLKEEEENKALEAAMDAAKEAGEVNVDELHEHVSIYTTYTLLL